MVLLEIIFEVESRAKCLNPSGLIGKWTSEQSLSPVSGGGSDWINSEADWRDMVAK
jgi:hypothetical protein